MVRTATLGLSTHPWAITKLLADRFKSSAPQKRDKARSKALSKEEEWKEKRLTFDMMLKHIACHSMKNIIFDYITEC